MIAADTNLLVYSHHDDSGLREAAKDLIGALRHQSAWTIPCAEQAAPEVLQRVGGSQLPSWSQAGLTASYCAWMVR